MTPAPEQQRARKRTADGYGQNLIADIRSGWRFLACRRRAAQWRQSPEGTQEALHLCPMLERFGDFVFTADPIDEAPWQGQRWFVIERIWHGFPDPPRYAFFALQGDTVWAAQDFSTWPTAWTVTSAG